MSKGSRRPRWDQDGLGSFSCMNCLSNGNEFESNNFLIMEAHKAICDGSGRV